MYWELPPEFKIYEALGAIADGRLELVTRPANSEETEEEDLNIIQANQYSSNKNKFYTIKYSPETSQIMTNDNATWFVGYLGYPALSLLLYIDRIKCDRSILKYFKDIAFKEINQKNKNNFQKAGVEIDQILSERGLDLDLFKQECDSIFKQLAALGLKPLGKKVRPPKEISLK